MRLNFKVPLAEILKFTLPKIQSMDHLHFSINKYFDIYLGITF